jgi:hypothetical protein
MFRKTRSTSSIRALVAFAGVVTVLIAEVHGAVLRLPPAISEDSRSAAPIGATFAAAATTACFGSAQSGCAEPTPLFRPAIGDDAVRYSVVAQILSDEISKTASAHRGRRGDPANRAHSGLGDFGGDNFLPWPFWPYFNYCTRHPGDQNC